MRRRRLGAIGWCAALAWSNPASAGPVSSLDAIQGAWWSSCLDPAAEFVIAGARYSGDFAGTFELELAGDVLVFKQGLVDGHATGVAGEPVAFRVVRAGGEELVLRRMAGDPTGPDWRLQACGRRPG